MSEELGPRCAQFQVSNLCELQGEEWNCDYIASESSPNRQLGWYLEVIFDFDLGKYKIFVIDIFTLLFR